MVKNKSKYNASALSGVDDIAAVGALDDEAPGFNIMYDKRVFRGNTYNMNLLK